MVDVSAVLRALALSQLSNHCITSSFFLGVQHHNSWGTPCQMYLFHAVRTHGLPTTKARSLSPTSIAPCCYTGAAASGKLFCLLQKREILRGEGSSMGRDILTSHINSYCSKKSPELQLSRFLQGMPLLTNKNINTNIHSICSGLSTPSTRPGK